MKQLLTLICLFSITLAGCVPPDPSAPVIVTVETQTQTPPTPAAIRSSTPTQTATLTPTLAAPAACVPANERQEASVSRVVDGDTIEVMIGYQKQVVRYIGIDTPEDTARVEPFGQEATAKNEELVGRQKVILIKDVSEVDRYGRLLRYVFVGDVFVNYTLVAEGYAYASAYPPDVSCAETFQKAQQAARESDKGLWGPTPSVPPSPTYRPKIAPTKEVPPPP